MKKLCRFIIEAVQITYKKLSDAAKAQVKNLQWVDPKITQLKQKQAILQTARNTHANALEAELPKEC